MTRVTAKRPQWRLPPPLVAALALLLLLLLVALALLAMLTCVLCASTRL